MLNRISSTMASLRSAVKQRSGHGLGQRRRARRGGVEDASIEEGDPDRRRPAGRRLGHHGVLHPQRPLVADADLRRHRAPRSARRCTSSTTAPTGAPGTCAARSTQTIGVISDFVASGAFASQMLTGASAAARSCDHLLVIGETLGDPAVEGLLIGEMVDRQVDGIVYLTVAASLVTVPEPLRERPHRAAQLPRRTSATCRPCCPTTRPAAGWRPSTCWRPAWARSVWVVGDDFAPRVHRRARPAARAVARPSSEAGVPLAGVVPCAWDVAPGARRGARLARPRRTVPRPWSASTTGSRWGPTRRWPS